MDGCSGEFDGEGERGRGEGGKGRGRVEGGGRGGTEKGPEDNAARSTSSREARTFKAFSNKNYRSTALYYMYDTLCVHTIYIIITLLFYSMYVHVHVHDVHVHDVCVCALLLWLSLFCPQSINNTSRASRSLTGASSYVTCHARSRSNNK